MLSPKQRPLTPLTPVQIRLGTPKVQGLMDNIRKSLFRTPHYTPHAPVEAQDYFGCPWHRKRRILPARMLAPFAFIKIDANTRVLNSLSSE